MGDKKLQIGSVIWADVQEPCGKDAGEHPCVVLSSNEEIESGKELRVAVCSTGFTLPLPSGWFHMPTHPGGDPQTGLTEACVVKATWIEKVDQSKIRLTRGRAPAKVFRQIKNWLEDKERQMRLQ